MSHDNANRIASPTIAEVLARFLADQEERLAPSTFGNYREIIDLLQHSLNGYAYQSLDKADGKLFDHLYNATGDQHREFCEIFGPEHILPNMGEFLGYFMVRKVMAGKETLRAAGTVTKKLAKWLAAQGCVEAEDADDAVERGGAAARDLPAAEELSRLLEDVVDELGEEDATDVNEGHFTFTRVEAKTGRVWVEGLDGHEVGPFELPADIARCCKVGWTVSGMVGRRGKRWHFIETWNVYPR